MNKQEALTKLALLEKETAELRAIIEAPEKPLSILDSPSYETACKIEGIDPIQSLPFLDPQNIDQEWHNAAHKLRTIAKVLRNGSDNKLYYPVFNVSGGGFSFAYVSWYAYHCYRDAAAGLCVQDVDTAKFFGTQPEFISIWKIYINN